MPSLATRRTMTETAPTPGRDKDREDDERMRFAKHPGSACSHAGVAEPTSLLAHVRWPPEDSAGQGARCWLKLVGWGVRGVSPSVYF